jgi:hypothetical protein
MVATLHFLILVNVALPVAKACVINTELALSLQLSLEDKTVQDLEVP